MKVLMLARLYAPHVGGVEKHVEKISEQLGNNHKITVVCEMHENNLPDRETIKGVRVIRIPVGGVGEANKKWRIWSWWLGNRELFSEADLIHIHDVFFWIMPYLYLFPKKKVYMTFHGYEGGLPNKKQVFWHRLAAKMSRGNICIGGWHEKWYGVKPDFVSYGATDVRFLPAGKRQGAIFIGRQARDTGWAEYGQVAKRKKMPLAQYTNTPDAARWLPKYEYAFVSGYLSIVEALKAQTPVLAYYHNELKKDYLETAPFRPYINVFSRPEEARLDVSPEQVRSGKKWADRQTWSKVAKMYEQLWSR